MKMATTTEAHHEGAALITNGGNSNVSEIETLQREYEWLLKFEVNDIVEQLQGVIAECSKRFPLSIPGHHQTEARSDKFIMQNTIATSADQSKVVATLTGDSISHADISLRLPKHSQPSQRTIVQNDAQWKLQQIQDAGNHLMQAMNLLNPNRVGGRFKFTSGQEVRNLMSDVMTCVGRGRACLVVPKKRTIEEIMQSRNMKSLQPPLPNDVAVSFYIQSYKLVFAVYHVQKDPHGQQKFDVLQAECSVPWLSEVLVLFTVALQLCQQLKDKVEVFNQYNDFTVPDKI
ncbi:protein rogdi-like [Varroa destructor]|uniref:Protein rogdi n=1 Tax=Varroa destructor TaxID=109461 RepID=A0A7M7KU54_VARDE|nr:protein rogdi-like [Varroa destructor]XP_022665903.1 protein rogdi-like [Varroa destructor]